MRLEQPELSGGMRSGRLHARALSKATSRKSAVDLKPYSLGRPMSQRSVPDVANLGMSEIVDHQ